MMTIEEIYQIYKQHPVVTTDSRDCPAGSMFFALKGASFDGNQYALSALEKGCAVAVVDEQEYALDDRFILVHDVLKTLQDLAAWHRRQWGGPVLQITGTNGKTTTKELVSTVLQQAHKVLFTQGNLNNHIGVPRTLLRITDENDMAVIETGANHPGEIKFLCRMVQADCGLITNVGRAHLEGFGSFEGVKKTKGELYDDLQHRGGYIFLNALDDDLREMSDQRGFRLFDTALPYVEGRVEECNPFVKMQWREDADQPWHTVQTHLIGAYNIANLRAAVTIGLHFGVSPEKIDEAIANYVPTNNRSEFRDTGRNHLIVDAYNANPSSMNAALTNFQFIEDAHRMAILGDMKELGAESVAEHQKVVDKLAGMKLENVWLVGTEFAKCDFTALPQHRLFDSVDEVMQALENTPLNGKTLLIKGSNSTRLYLLSEKL